MSRHRPNLKTVGAAALRTGGKGEHPAKRITEPAATGFLNLPLDAITPNPTQPRRHFDPERLHELALTIRAKGVIEPVVVASTDDRNRYLLLAGERRLRAAKEAGLAEIPALVRSAESDPLELALIENLQRENLTAIEQAEALGRLKKEKGYTDLQLAAVLGKSRVTVTEILKLCALPEEVRHDPKSATLSKSALVQIARTPEPKHAFAAVKSGLAPSVRELRVRKASAKGRPAPTRQAEKKTGFAVPSWTFDHRPTGMRLMVAAAKKITRRALAEVFKAALKHFP